MVVKILITFVLSSVLAFSAMAKSKKGTETGGGGDASEARVNEIRTDILNWINDKGAVGLNFPPELSYGEYVESMLEILAPQKVIIGFVEEDHRSNPELMVSVKGIPKTCRGFISKINSAPHIICHIARFKNTPDAEQYRLIHHEYAGLAGVEENIGAASDYRISSQLTDFLIPQIVLKLAIRRNIITRVSKKACFVFSATEYCVGDRGYLGEREGIISGINKIQNLVSLKFNNGIDGTFEAKMIASGRGCLNEYCVDLDAVVEGHKGTIVGVNAYQKHITIKFQDESILAMNFSKTSVGSGCLRAICVGNKGHASNFGGEVVAINKYENKISMLLENGKYFTFKSNNVAVGKGCLSGFCVGDKAGYGPFAGEVVGINPVEFLLEIKMSDGTYMPIPLIESTVDSHTNEFDTNPEMRDITKESDFINAFNK